jgi:hypothetical protein
MNQTDREGERMRRRQDYAKAKLQGAGWHYLLVVVRRISEAHQLDGRDELLAFIEKKKLDCKNTAQQIALPNMTKHPPSVFDNFLHQLSQVPQTMLEMRTVSNWSQEELAAKLGWSTKMIIRYENSNYGNAPLKRLIQYAEFMREHRQHLLEQRHATMLLAQLEAAASSDRIQGSDLPADSH